MPDIIGNAIDRLCTVDARNRGMPHDFLTKLYDEARKLVRDRPISMVAAEKLVATLSRGDVVLILTGAGLKPILPEGKNDGPPGTAALSRALYRGIGAVPIYVLEQHHARPFIASSQSLGLMVTPFDEAKKYGLGAAVELVPDSQDAVPQWVEDVLAHYQPKAIISTERLGPGKNGQMHSATAMPLSAFDPTPGAAIDTSPLVDAARTRGILTVGIGDHGNEIGFGAIYDKVVEIVPKGETMAATTSTDILFPAMMSNWGCYGIKAALAFLLGRADLMHTPEEEERLLRDCLHASRLEAAYCSTNFLIDGLESESSMAVVQLLGNIVRKNLEPPSRGLAH